MSAAKDECQSTETLSFRCWREWCRLTRGAAKPSKGKCAFTLGELLITLVIIGVLAAIMIPIIKSAIPDKYEALHKKAINTLEQTVAYIINNEEYYPAKKIDGKRIYTLANTDTTYVNGKTARGETKFCKLFAEQVRLKPNTKINCSKEAGFLEDGKTPSIITLDGVQWLLPIGYFTEKGGKKYPIKFKTSFDGKGPNCEYDPSKPKECLKPDIFTYYLDPEGRLIKPVEPPTPDNPTPNPDPNPNPNPDDPDPEPEGVCAFDSTSEACCEEHINDSSYIEANQGCCAYSKIKDANKDICGVSGTCNLVSKSGLGDDWVAIEGEDTFFEADNYPLSLEHRCCSSVQKYTYGKRPPCCCLTEVPLKVFLDPRLTFTFSKINASSKDIKLTYTADPYVGPVEVQYYLCRGLNNNFLGSLYSLSKAYSILYDSSYKLSESYPFMGDLQGIPNAKGEEGGEYAPCLDFLKNPMYFEINPEGPFVPKSNYFIKLYKPLLRYRLTISSPGTSTLVEYIELDELYKEITYHNENLVKKINELPSNCAYQDGNNLEFLGNSHCNYNSFVTPITITFEIVHKQTNEMIMQRLGCKFPSRYLFHSEAIFKGDFSKYVDVEGYEIPISDSGCRPTMNEESVWSNANPKDLYLTTPYNYSYDASYSDGAHCKKINGLSLYYNQVTKQFVLH